jgi:hypothetical protein
MDSFPWRWLAPRAIDVLLYFLVVIAFSTAAFYPILGLEASGLVILVIGLYSEYRQNSHYSVSPIENSLISGELVHSPVHQIAKFRNRIAKLNILIIIAGTTLTCWGVLRGE